MQTNIVSVKYEDKYEPQTFGGIAYSYLTSIRLNVGDLVMAPTKNGEQLARVSEIDIPLERIENNPKINLSELKTITKKIDRETYINFAVIIEDVA